MIGLAVAAVVERGQFRLDVDFTAAPGEVVAVLGPNGAGKTTLLRAIAGLTALSEGRISLDGQPFDDVPSAVFRPAHQRPVGLVFQNYRLFPHLSVLDNVAFGPRSKSVNRRAARATATSWLGRFGLREYADRKPGALSGGQAQRVALARALAGDPALLLLDEPLAALDARTRIEVRAELRRHLADFAGPTLLITHDPLDAMILADRLLVIEDGQIVQAGSPGEVARRPQTQYVAQLVGLNLYRGVLADGQVTLVDGGTVPVPAETAARLVPAEPAADATDATDATVDGDAVDGPADDSAVEPVTVAVLVAIRPSAIGLHTARPAATGERFAWLGRVDGLESLTDRVRVHVDAAPSALVDITADAVADLKLADGAEVWLSVEVAQIDAYPELRWASVSG